VPVGGGPLVVLLDEDGPCQVQQGLGLGKTPTTSVRRLISLLTRSINRLSSWKRSGGSRACSIDDLQVLVEGGGDVRVSGVLAGPSALLGLAGAVLIETHDEWQVSDRRYLSEGSMALINTQPTDPRKEAAVPELIAS